MIKRELYTPIKLSVKHVTVENGMTEWFGGQLVFPAPATNSVLSRDRYGYLPGSFGVPSDGLSDSVLSIGAGGNITATYGGEYDQKDFLFFTQPVATVGKTDYVGSYLSPIGITFHSSNPRPTEIGLPDSKEFITVIFFPCIVTLSLDADEYEKFGNVFSKETGSSFDSPMYVYPVVQSNSGKLSVIGYEFSNDAYRVNADNSTVRPIGMVLAADTVNERDFTIYFRGF